MKDFHHFQIHWLSRGVACVAIFSRWILKRTALSKPSSIVSEKYEKEGDKGKILVKIRSRVLPNNIKCNKLSFTKFADFSLVREMVRVDVDLVYVPAAAPESTNFSETHSDVPIDTGDTIFDVC